MSTLNVTTIIPSEGTNTDLSLDGKDSGKVAIVDDASGGGDLTVTGGTIASGNATIGTDGGDTRYSLNSANQYTVVIKNGGNIAGQIGGGGSDILRFSNAAGATMWESNAGQITKPLTPAFFAYNSTSRSNVTGDAVTYTVLFDTEVFDQNADFASNTFTAPVTGRYFLQGQVSTDAQTTTNTDGILGLVTSNRSLSVYYNPGNMEGVAATGQCSISFSGIFDMDASDTAYVTIKIYQGTQIINVQPTNTFFTGALIA